MVEWLDIAYHFEIHWYFYVFWISSMKMVEIGIRATTGYFEDVPRKISRVQEWEIANPMVLPLV